MKEFLKRFLIGSLAVLVLAGSQTTQVFARNKTVQWMAQKLTEMSLIVQDASVLDWDDEDGALIILGHSDPDRVVYFEPDRTHKEGQSVVVIDPTIKSDDSRIQKVMFGGGDPGAHGYITVTVIGTERVMKVCLDTPDIYILRHDSGTGVFERTEKEGPETKKWYCLYAKDKVRACEAPQTGEINEYKASEGKWDITVPFAESNKVLFGGSAILYDWNDNEIASSKYKAGDSGVTFSGTDFTNIIPGYTYYVQTVPDEGLDCDSEGFVYRSVTQPGEKMPFALGCKGSDPVDSGNAISGFVINYGYKEDNSGYEPALKWNGKIESDNSLLIKPKNNVSDWILKTRETGESSVSITVDSADSGAHVAIDNSASSAFSHITKKSDNVRMGCSDGTLLAKSGDKQYLATKYNEDLKQVLTATAEDRSMNSLKFKFAAVGKGESALEVPAIATLRDSFSHELQQKLSAGSDGVEFTGLEAGQTYQLTLKIDNSAEFMPEGCNGIISNKSDTRILYAAELKWPVEADTLSDKVENVKVNVKDNGNIRIVNPNKYKIDYKIVKSPSWKEGDPVVSSGTVGRESEHIDTNFVKTDKGESYYVFYRYNDPDKNAVSKYWTKHPDEIYVGNLKTIKANWKTDISDYKSTYSDDELSLRAMLITAGEAVISETGEVYKDTGVSVYAINEKDYTTDEALMTDTYKVRDTSNYDAGTYVAIVGIDLTAEEAAQQGYRVVNKSETKKFTVARAELTLEILPTTRTVFKKTGKVKKSDWTVGVKEDDTLVADSSGYKLHYSNDSVTGQITDEERTFDDETEYSLSISPVDEDAGFVIKRGDTVLNNKNYAINGFGTATLYVSDIEDGSSLEARRNDYTDKLYYDDLKSFTSNEDLKTYLDVFVDNDKKLDAVDYKLVVDDVESGNIADLDEAHKKTGASFTVSVQPNVEDLPVTGNKNKLTLTVGKQPITIIAAQPELLSQYVGDNPVRRYSGKITVNKLNIYGITGDEITERFGDAMSDWASADAASVDMGLIDKDRPGKYKIELKDITDSNNNIALKAAIDENYSLVRAEGDYTIETALTVSLYDVATGKKLASDQVVRAGAEDIIFETTNKGEATTYTQWYIRDCNSEGEKLSWPSALGFDMESYNTTGLKIKRVKGSAVEITGNLEVYGRFPSDRKSGDEGEFYVSDIDPVVYNGNKFVAECDSKFLDKSGEVKKGYTAQLGLTVFYGNNILTYGTDYTLSYKNNLSAAKADAGKAAPTVIVKGIGAYKGKKVEKTFTILPAELSRLGELKLDKEYFRYNGKEMSTVIKGNVLYSVGTKTGKKFAKNSYTFRIYDINGNEVSNKVMPKESEYGIYSVVAIATGRDANFKGETEEVKVNVLPASAKGKLKIKGVKKSVAYTAKGVDYTAFLDAAQFQITAGKLVITDIEDPRITIDIVESPSEDAFAIKTLSNAGDFYLRIKPSQFNTFAVENIYEPEYVKISFKGTPVKNLVKVKNKKHAWNGSNHNIELNISNKVTDPADIYLYREPIEKDFLGTKIEQYIGTLAEFADKGYIPGAVLDNSVSGTYVIKIIGGGSCYGTDGIKYTVESPKYNKKSVTAYINSSNKQEDVELDFNRAGYSDDLVKVYWKDPSDANAKPVLLNSGVDYSLVWGKNDQVGKNKGSVTIVGKNTYFSGSFKKTFTINRTDISKVLYDRSVSSALLGSKTADPYLYQTPEFGHEDMPTKAVLIQGVDFKVTGIVENAGSKTATATIDASDSKYFCGTINTITYDLYPVEVASVELTLDRSTVLLENDYLINSSIDDFGNRYLDSFAEGNVKVASAKITFKDNKAVILSGDEIDDNFVIGYANADKTGSARVMVRFKDGKKYPTGPIYYSKEYTIMLKQ